MMFGALGKLRLGVVSCVGNGLQVVGFCVRTVVGHKMIGDFFYI